MKKKEYEKSKRTLREDVKMIARGMRIVLEISPQYIIYNILFQIMQVVPSYFTLYMTAQLVNELAKQCDGKRLAMLAGITVLGQFAVSAVIRMVLVPFNIQQETLRIREELYMFDKQHGLEYEHLENPEVTLLREKIYQAMSANNSGLMSLFWDTSSLVAYVVDLAASTALTFSLFRMVKGVEVSGFLAFVNSPWCAVLLVGILLAHGLLTVQFTKEHTAKSMDAISGVAEQNAYLHSVQYLRGEDIMVFDLKKTMRKEFEKRVKSPWIVKWTRIEIRYGILSILEFQLQVLRRYSRLPQGQTGAAGQT